VVKYPPFTNANSSTEHQTLIPSQQDFLKKGVIMKSSKTLVILSVLVAVLASIAAAGGLFWQDEGEPFTFTTLHGQTVEIYGQGLYRHDSSFHAPVLRGTDAIMLFACVPLLVVAILLYRRGTLRSRFLLTGALTCFLYNAASLALGAAYNNLFLLYVVYFSASLYAFVLAFTSIDLEALPAHIAPRLPSRGIAVFMFIAGLSPCVWLIEIVAALVQGQAPQNLASYTTDVTTVIDVGIITPAAFLAGLLLLRRKPLGYLLATTLLILLTLVGLVVVGQTVMQTLDGVVLSTGELMTYMMPFVLLSLIAVWLTIILFRNLSDSPKATEG
jgi:hypothetical protein